MARIHGVLGCLAAAGVILVSEGDAAACGGCFAPPTEVTTVTDHRMAFQISTQQTVLWDQIRYTGDPKEFAWVLPVRAGTVVEASSDAWFATLEAFTVPTIIGPRPQSSGCSIGCSASDTSSLRDNGGVEVISQTVVGPYEAATLRSSDPNALDTWLKTNGYSIPPSIEPTIAAYVAEKFDFIALKLRPGQGIRAMRPVRVVFPGSDNSLPLRMVAAGVGAQVAITLFVFGEGRYHPQNFPDAVMNEGELFWDAKQAKSNYAELSLAAMAQNDGRSWLTEFAERIDLATLDNFFVSNGGGFGGGQQSGYTKLCQDELRDGGVFPMTDASMLKDAASDASDDANDASDDASDASDASDDASSDDASSDDASTMQQKACDDLDVAKRGLHPADTWITRLRGNLPTAALATDLKLEAAPAQTGVSNIHNVGTNESRGGGGCSAAPAGDIAGTAAEIVSCLFAVAALLRRRKNSHGPS